MVDIIHQINSLTIADFWLVCSVLFVNIFFIWLYFLTRAKSVESPVQYEELPLYDTTDVLLQPKNKGTSEIPTYPMNSKVSFFSKALIFILIFIFIITPFFTFI